MRAGLWPASLYKGKNAAYPDISLGNLNSDIYAWDPVNRR
ncbi:MAG: hypothetical protein WAqTSA_42900 [Shewanella algae]|uniref:Uncharacterized protein n=1 Tax=Klebsiella pneumoniae TaxID=573 RepID=A0A4P8WBN6_KLEPN|nr:hypothetical protein [Klebsiella pneumoniae]QKY82629.1 hypothetical protein [Klebsiella pneumoniae]WCD55957.1 hypothetical protein [Klebsiella pneumoniae]